MRTPIIAGNWKMNMTPRQALTLFKEIEAHQLDSAVDAVICVPAIDLQTISNELANAQLALGAQNMYFEEKGAFTGEIAPGMLAELSVSYVILGHSERREIFHEEDTMIARKVAAALAHGLTPILCVGETLEEREAARQEEKVGAQLKADLEGLAPEEVAKIVVAYEPIWAIGTGKTASAADAQAMAAFIRRTLEAMFGTAVAEKVRIQYGGSVKPSNVVEIMGQEDIDGALVGGASLDAESFVHLVNYQSDAE